MKIVRPKVYDNSQIVLYKYKQPMVQRYLLDNYESCKSYFD